VDVVVSCFSGSLDVVEVIISLMMISVDGSVVVELLVAVSCFLVDSVVPMVISSGNAELEDDLGSGSDVDGLRVSKPGDSVSMVETGSFSVADCSVVLILDDDVSSKIGTVVSFSSTIPALGVDGISDTFVVGIDSGSVESIFDGLQDTLVTSETRSVTIDTIVVTKVGREEGVDAPSGCLVVASSADSLLIGVDGYGL